MLGLHTVLIPLAGHTHTLIWLHGTGGIAAEKIDKFIYENTFVSCTTKIILI